MTDSALYSYWWTRHLCSHSSTHVHLLSPLFSPLSLQLLKYLLESFPILQTQRTSLYLQNIFSRPFEDQERLSQKKNQLGGERETHIMLSSECSFRHSLLHIFPVCCSVQEFMELDLMCNLPREPIEMQAIPTGIPVEKIATDA